MDNGLEQAASYLRNARRVAVLTGAGVSKESGVPTYRDALTGLWSRYSFEELASPEGFQRNPAAVWTWYTERREQLAHVEPNPGHIALAQFEALFERWDLITQNVDDLHERAGSARVCHLHGRLMETKCFADCRGAPTLIAPEAFVNGAQPPPTCPYCGSWLRPNVVWFGEMLALNDLIIAQDAAEECDVMLVVGTSGLVFPAANLPNTAAQNGAAVIEINPEATDISRIANVSLRGPSGTLLPMLLEWVRA
ncbi:MAG: NAD-dependent deacylase [Anaerolineae bacterium]|nr:NAD-dependent deacylase [Anaerolineae bacterium]